jgi:hypothetical protein
MYFSYLDESGDLGESGSKFLILTLICIKSQKKFSKIISKYRTKILKTKKGQSYIKKTGGELKFAYFPDENLLENLLSEFMQHEIDIYYKKIKKNNETISIYEKETILVNLYHHICKSNNKIPNKIIADLSYFNKNKKNCYSIEPINDNKNRIILSCISEEEAKKTDKCSFCIEHDNSRQNELLQVVDLISGSIFCKYERDNKKYYEIIKGKIRN